MQSITSDDRSQLARVREARVLFQAEQAQRGERLKQRLAERESQTQQRAADPTGQRGTKLDTSA